MHMTTKNQQIFAIGLCLRVNLLQCPVEAAWVLEQFKCLLSFNLWVTIECMLLSCEKLDKDASLLNTKVREDSEIAVS